MRAIILERQRIDDAAAREGQAGLPRQERDFLRPAEAQPVRAAVQQAGREQPGHVGGRDRAIGDAAGAAWRPRSSAPARTARASRCARLISHRARLCAERRAPRRRRRAPAPPASRGTKTVAVMPRPPARRRSAPASSRPSGRPSSMPAGPTAHRPRQNTGSSVTAPSGVVPCQSTPSRAQVCGRERVGAQRLAGLGAAELQHVPAGRVVAEIVIEGDDPVHLGAGDVQRRGDHRDGVAIGTQPNSACSACRIGSAAPSRLASAAMIAAPRASLHGS